MEPAETARFHLHAGNGGAHLRHAEGEIPESGRDDVRMLGAGQDDDVDVRARLDAALQGIAEYSLHGDAAADPRQYRRARRRHECAARSLQHSGADRYRPYVQPPAGLYEHPGRKGDRSRNLHVDTRFQAAAPQPDELLAELSQVLRQFPEGDVGQRRDRRKRLCFRLAAEARRAELRHVAHLRHDA